MLKTPMILAAAALLIAEAGSAAAEPAYEVLHVFEGWDLGMSPFGGVTRDAEGNIYGTTAGGGVHKCRCGTVYRLAPDGGFTVLQSFAGLSENGHKADSAAPIGFLVRDQRGNLYGASHAGGSPDCFFAHCGTVFKVSASGNKKILHVFDVSDGDVFAPSAGLIADSAGTMFGVAANGGPGQGGGVFKITPGGRESVLHAFTGIPEGLYPSGGLIRDQSGNFYGMTYKGGMACELDPDGCGSVYKMTPRGEVTVLHSFGPEAEGFEPRGRLTMDAKGNLYGVMESGGIASDDGGFGTVFKLTPNGRFSVFHSFTGGSDGAHPTYGLVLSPDGNLYGTTGRQGGPCDCGTIFRLTLAGKLKTIHVFEGPEGAHPEAEMIADGDGNLYGVTSRGGSCSGSGWGCGAVFRITP